MTGRRYAGWLDMALFAVKGVGQGAGSHVGGMGAYGSLRGESFTPQSLWRCAGLIIDTSMTMYAYLRACAVT